MMVAGNPRIVLRPESVPSISIPFLQFLTPSKPKDVLTNDIIEENATSGTGDSCVSLMDCASVQDVEYMDVERIDASVSAHLEVNDKDDEEHSSQLNVEIDQANHDCSHVNYVTTPKKSVDFMSHVLSQKLHYFRFCHTKKNSTNSKINKK
ncbi:uncharacterized protein LOC105279908 isoform X2 [Ooceraea biroi]|nr:uncharacterized protein LOC105279908 isoform X2 [Ooceraea biroi]